MATQPTNPLLNPENLMSAIPGLDKLTNSATGNIAELLSGNVNPGWARTANAYWSVGAGQPNSGAVGTFAGNRGADLYHLQSQANQQQGLQDLLALIGGYSGTVAPSAGQNLQNQQFNKQLTQSGSQFDQKLAFDKAQALFSNALEEEKLDAATTPWWLNPKNNQALNGGGWGSDDLTRYFPGDFTGSPAKAWY